jgi:hypothetical protein
MSEQHWNELVKIQTRAEEAVTELIGRLIEEDGRPVIWIWKTD